MIMGQLDRRRFDALAGYARHPGITSIADEIAWFASPSEHVLGIVIADRIDGDFGWVMFGQDEVRRYRAIDVKASHPTDSDAVDALLKAMRTASDQPKEAFFQGDVEGPPVDFFTPAIEEERFHPSFKILLKDDRFSPAREIISSMMRYHRDLDGNFIQKFQAAGFDPLLWELYLFATFNELGFIQTSECQVPDFILDGVQGSLAIEATSANPPDDGAYEMPDDPEEAGEYIENCIPIKLATALRNKLNRKPSYWEAPELVDVPFCLAVQDFHFSGAMQFIVSPATEYCFGIRHSIEGGERIIAKIGVHRYLNKKAKSGFFELPGAENISAVIVNPQGTITKFNRMGYIAGFGNPDVQMVRTGIQRNDANLNSPMPTPFRHIVDASYRESWVEGMVVLHNPNALIPLRPELIPGAAHEFLQSDGSIMSILPDFQPFSSRTSLAMRT